MPEIKKVVQRIYEFDFSKCELVNDSEIISTDHGNEFVNTFVKRDLDKGIIVTPSGYSKGMVYRSANNGEIYNCPTWLPDIVTFAFNVYGLKKGSFYRITVKAKNAKKYNGLTDVTPDRTLEVTNDNSELLIKEDLENNLEYKDCVAVFRAKSVEENLYFRLGKIAINNVIIDEVELVLDEPEEDAPTSVELDSGKSNIVGYGVFSSDFTNSTARYSELGRLTGKGLNLYFDKTNSEYILERDNYEDSIGASFTSANYIVEFNFNKAPYASYVITGVSPDVSPNTLKQGYIRFKISENGKPGKYLNESGRFAFIVKKIF